MTSAASNLEETVVEAFEPFANFAKVLLDAYAVVDKTGKVVKANQLFSQLTGIRMKQILRADSIDQLIQLAINEDKISISDLLEFKSPTRIDEVHGLLPESNEDKNLILSVYPLFDSREQAKIGLFVLMRDVTAETNLQDQYKDKAIQSITDPLTSLFTRAYFEDFLNGQIKRMEHKSPKERLPLSLAMCDIDFFKKVNDQYGHQAGDYVLKIVAGIMKSTFRKTDVCCRYGGEEFLVILPSADYDSASRAADTLRRAVEAKEIIFDGTRIPVTISCGVSTFDIETESVDNTMARADAALYEAKRSGRNQVFFHDNKEIKSLASLTSKASQRE